MSSTGEQSSVFFYITRKVQKSNAQGVTVQRQLKNSDIARKTN